jgi:hypothetical protein
LRKADNFGGFVDAGHTGAIFFDRFVEIAKIIAISMTTWAWVS